MNPSYPHPRQPATTLKSQRKRTVKHENPEKFKAFVNAAEAQPVAWVVFSEKKGRFVAKRIARRSTQPTVNL
jgi:hypothetical protein